MVDQSREPEGGRKPVGHLDTNAHMTQDRAERVGKLFLRITGEISPEPETGSQPPIVSLR